MYVQIHSQNMFNSLLNIVLIIMVSYYLFNNNTYVRNKTLHLLKYVNVHINKFLESSNANNSKKLDQQKEQKQQEQQKTIEQPEVNASDVLQDLDPIIPTVSSKLK